MLCIDSVVDQMFDDIWISEGPNHDVETVSEYAQRCRSTVDELVECLFDVLPSIGDAARVSELDAERNRDRQTSSSYVAPQDAPARHETSWDGVQIIDLSSSHASKSSTSPSTVPSSLSVTIQSTASNSFQGSISSTAPGTPPNALCPASGNRQNVHNPSHPLARPT